MDMSWLMELARRRAQQELRAGGLQNDMMETQRDDMAYNSRQARAPKMETAFSGTGMDNTMRRNAMSMSNDQAAQSGAQTQAMTRAAPQQYTFSPGGVGGYTNDTQAMNAFQRQAFMPEQSSFGGTPSAADTFAMVSGQARGQQSADVAGISQTIGLQNAGFFPRNTPSYQGYMGPQSAPGRALRQAGIQDTVELERQRRRSGLL
jgi:hypothetical protein